MTEYKREIKLYDDYPITVLEAVKLGDGTNSTAKDFIKNSISNSLNKKHPIQIDFNFTNITDIMKQTGITVSSEYISDDNFGDKQYCGGMCVNNKIYFCPNTANHILVYDIDNNYFYKIGDNLGLYPFKYTGMVQYGGFLFCVPRGVNDILRINPITDEVVKIELYTNYQENQTGTYTDSHHYNGCVDSNGNMYCPPAYIPNKKILKINLNTFETKELALDGITSTTFTGCCNIPNTNKILLLGNKEFVVWDCDTDTIESMTTFNIGDVYDMAYNNSDNCLYGFGKDRFVKYDITNKTAAIVATPSIGATYGTMLGVDGKFYTVAQTGRVCSSDTSGNTNIIDTTYNSSMTVSSAGLVLGNDCNIYSVPGSDKAIRIKFEGAKGKIPNYITTSRYYGKY